MDPTSMQVFIRKLPVCWRTRAAMDRALCSLRYGEGGLAKHSSTLILMFLKTLAGTYPSSTHCQLFCQLKFPYETSSSVRFPKSAGRYNAAEENGCRNCKRAYPVCISLA